MTTFPVTLHDEEESQELEQFLVDRIYEFNSKATGHYDGKFFGGSRRNESGAIIGGFNGHTWGGCCVIANLWVHEKHRRRGLGEALLLAAEAEASRRGCERVVLSTHSFQAPKFYERLGYEKVAVIDDYPRGFTDFIYVKRLRKHD
jgi:ribosomal protein S18 acetylase RimI-like enzyme